MRERLEPTADPESPRLYVRREGSRSSLWTATEAEPPSLYRERVIHAPRATLRSFDPTRSKLAAGILRGLRAPLPRPGERWLYLGAAGGTTASHVADLVGPEGVVFAVEKSLRPFVRLIAISEHHPGLRPLLADARRPAELLGLVPPVDGLYADIAQPDQVEILRANAREFLRSRGSVLLALKTASMGRELGPGEHAREAVRELRAEFDLQPPLPLEPFHRRHFLIAGRLRPRPLGDGAPRPPPSGVPPRPAGAHGGAGRRLHGAIARRYAGRAPR
jgi:fibrillarin-like pre-rRNA processing protein